MNTAAGGPISPNRYYDLALRGAQIVLDELERDPDLPPDSRLALVTFTLLEMLHRAAEDSPRLPLPSPN